MESNEKTKLIDRKYNNYSSELPFLLYNSAITRVVSIHSQYFTQFCFKNLILITMHLIYEEKCLTQLR